MKLFIDIDLRQEITKITSQAESIPGIAAGFSYRGHDVQIQPCEVNGCPSHFAIYVDGEIRVIASDCCDQREEAERVVDQIEAVAATIRR